MDDAEMEKELNEEIEEEMGEVDGIEESELEESDLADATADDAEIEKELDEELDGVTEEDV